MFIFLASLLISVIFAFGAHPPYQVILPTTTTTTTAAPANQCAIAYQRSHECHGDCDDFCLKYAWCEVSHTIRSGSPFSSNYCGWAWQAKCVCKTCQSGFCGRVKKRIEEALPIARRHVQKRIDDLTASLDGYNYGKFDEGVVPYHEGGSIGSLPFSTEYDCKNWCDQRSDCKSFARCDDNKRCWFKNLKLTGTESARHIGRCTTYYKSYKELSCSDWDMGGTIANQCSNGVLSVKYKAVKSKKTYSRPLVVEAEIRSTQHSECVSMTVFADDRDKNREISHEIGGWTNQWRFFPNDNRGYVGDVRSFQKISIELDAGTGVKFYINGQLKYTTTSSKSSGYIRFPKGCVNSEIRNIQVWSGSTQSVDDDWKMWFGDRNNHIRKPFMLNVLQNMKRYLGDVGYSDSNMVKLVALPEGDTKARMSCSRTAPCYGGEEKAWPDKIGFNVNVNSPRLLFETSLDKVAALMIHELTHATAVASRSNLALTPSDIDLTEANVYPHQNRRFMATRDWTYDTGEAKKYATCYESGLDCPGADSSFNNRPAVNMNMDIPLNNAANYEKWILYVNEGGSNCVSGDMLVESESSGPIRAGALLAGMKIRGRDAQGNSQWCTVQDIYFNGMGALFGNFTEGHLVLDDSAGMVVPSGNSSLRHFGARYTIFTDCPVMENKDGELFTPLAQTFCGAQDFSWSEYLVLWRAIQQIVRDTGIFWFHLDETFTTCKNETLCGNVTDWRDALPPVCESLMSCAASQDDVICDDFEEVAQNFFDRHVRADRVAEIKNAYAQYGSISRSVKDSSKNENHLWMWIAIAAGGFVGMMAILLVTWRCCCHKKQEEENEVVVV